jgi:hypothetical protein
VHPWLAEPAPELFWSRHVTKLPEYVPKLNSWTTKRLDKIASQPRDVRPRLVKVSA